MTLRIGVTCYPTFGGSGVVATELGLGLARRGHAVHFIAHDVPARLERFADNVFFHEVEELDYPLFAHSNYALALASKMVAVATYEQLDLLHVHYAVPHATSAYLARQIMGAKAPRIVTTLHGTDITLVGSDPSYLPITRFSIEQSDGVTTPSVFLRDATYERLAIARTLPIEVIANFVDTERFAPARKLACEDLRRMFPRCPVGDRAHLLVHISNFRPLKRVDDVVRIFAEVRAAGEPALLALIGDGPERSRVEQLVRELGLGPYVCMLGKQLSFIEVLQGADVFLLPSETESFGLAALEALSCGVPVVATDVGGIPEVVEDGATGYLCPLGDVQAMAAATLRILRDAKLHERLRKTAREHVLQRWQMGPAVERYERYYEQVMGGPRRSQ